MSIILFSKDLDYSRFDFSSLGVFSCTLLDYCSPKLLEVWQFVQTHACNRLTKKIDYAELSQPSVFSYGFYLPQTILIFLMCIVYSVLRSSWQVLLPGLFYFIAGHFVHKYQLLYSMDHSQHSTGKSWNIICDRVLVGLIIFQISMAGQLALRAAIKRSFLIIPLVAGTLWFSYVYNQSYKPLMTYIALKSIRKAEHADRVGAERRYSWETRDRIGGRMTVDETRETGLRFIHPNLIAP